MSTRDVNRRRFLKNGIGGLLMLPFMPSLLPRQAWGQTSSRPKRFVFIGSRWGRDIDRGKIVVDGVSRSPWYPHGEPQEIRDGIGISKLSDIRGFDGFISPVFSEAWDSLRNKFTIIRGLDGMQGGDGHGTGMTLTGSGTQPGGQVGFGYSIDVVMQESSKIYPQIPLIPAIRTSVGSEFSHSFSYTSQTGFPTKVPSEVSPFNVYNRLFHPNAVTERSQLELRGRPIINNVMEEYKALLKPGLISYEDRYKLESHMDLISRIEKTLGISLPNCAIPQPYAANNAEDLHDMTMDLEIAALACGATNIVSHVILQHNSEIKPNEEEAHSAAHNGISSPEGSGRAAIMQWSMDKWVMTRVATFIKKLDAIDDGNGKTLLDNTIVFYGNWEARGNHAFYDMPVIVAGSPDILNMGYYLDYRPRPLNNFAPGTYPGRPYNNLLVTLLKSMGLGPEDYERFGQKGFGIYDGYNLKLADHYRPYLQDRNAHLPLFYKG